MFLLTFSLVYCTLGIYLMWLHFTGESHCYERKKHPVEDKNKTFISHSRQSKNDRNDSFSLLIHFHELSKHLNTGLHISLLQSRQHVIAHPNRLVGNTNTKIKAN